MKRLALGLASEIDSALPMIVGGIEDLGLGSIGIAETDTDGLLTLRERPVGIYAGAKQTEPTTATRPTLSEG
jgi:hypothetical protein